MPAKKELKPVGPVAPPPPQGDPISIEEAEDIMSAAQAPPARPPSVYALPPTSVDHLAARSTFRGPDPRRIPDPETTPLPPLYDHDGRRVSASPTPPAHIAALARRCDDAYSMPITGDESDLSAHLSAKSAASEELSAHASQLRTARAQKASELAQCDQELDEVVRLIGRMT